MEGADSLALFVEFMLGWISGGVGDKGVWGGGRDMGSVWRGMGFSGGIVDSIWVDIGEGGHACANSCICCSTFI